MPKSKLKNKGQRMFRTDPDVDAGLELLLRDPVSGKAKYGELSRYLNSLVRADLRRKGFLS